MENFKIAALKLKIKIHIKERTNTNVLKLYFGKLLNFVEKFVTPSSKYIVKPKFFIKKNLGAQNIEIIRKLTELYIYLKSEV